MPLYDLLWACPACGEDRGLLDDDRTCSACGTRFVREAGSAIRSTAPDGSITVRTPAEWIDMLPEPAALLGNQPVRTAHVMIQPVTGEAKVTGTVGFLNRIEVFGDETPGTLTLLADALVVAEGGEGAEGVEQPQKPRGALAGDSWGLETLTAVQTSSKTLQIKRRGASLVSFRFLDDSVYLWERLIRAAIRDFYARTGRGEVLEFQPRIVARAP